MTVVRVTCKGCGDQTTFNGTTPDNDHITLVSGTPNVNALYKCNSCNSSSTDTGFTDSVFLEEVV